jgi:hypothetical protein
MNKFVIERLSHLELRRKGRVPYYEIKTKSPNDRPTLEGQSKHLSGILKELELEENQNDNKSKNVRFSSI